MTILGVIVGILISFAVGCISGIIIMALCAAAGRYEER